MYKRPKFKPIKRNCLNCNEGFLAIREWHVFHIPSCRLAYWRRQNYLGEKKVSDLEVRIQNLEQKLGIKDKEK